MWLRLYPAHASQEVLSRHANGRPARSIWRAQGYPPVETYDVDDGELAHEAQIDDEGRYHGIYREWGGGTLSQVTSYHHGLEDGVALQFDSRGQVVCSYVMRRGTGVDLWCGQDGMLTEERHYVDGGLHGPERIWSPSAVPTQLDAERWYRGNQLHGISRSWDDDGRLEDGSPQFFVDGRQVDRADYERECALRDDLVAYCVDDDRPQRPAPWWPQPVATLRATSARRGPA